MQRLRKPHTKSRAGCLTCKKRHKKCGEERPACQKCVDRDLQCEYVERQDSNSLAGSERVSTEPTLHEELNVVTSRMEELSLMIHYMGHTCESMSHGLDLSVWKIYIPEEAVRFEFLMDGILALSSLHMAFNSSGLDQRYNELAIHYQNVGLRRYTEALKHITTYNTHALFGFAIITTVMAIATPGSHRQIDVPEYKKSLVSIFELLLGVRIIGKASGEVLKPGRFSLLFQDLPVEVDRPVVAPDVANALNILRERASTVAKYVQPEKKGIYLSGIDQLELAFGSVAKSSHLGYVVAWPAMVDERLLELFKQGDPMVELIILHYGVLLLYLHDRWWGRNFGLKLIEELVASISAISPEWASWTDWVKDRAAIVAAST